MAKTSFLSCQQALEITVFFGFLFHHMLRANMPIALVEMIEKNTSSNFSTKAPRFKWTEEQRNDILGYFFWGYLITQVPGGRLSEKFGFKKVVGVGLTTASICTLLVPWVSQWGYKWVIFLRFLLGVMMGVHWPSTPPIANRWIPPTERSKFMSHMVASSLGVALIFPISGYLISYFGWPSVFYTTGSVVLIWAMFWWIVIHDSPGQHPRIAQEEKVKLERMLLSTNSRKKSVPWRKIFTSGPVWAVIVSNTAVSYNFFVMFNQLPSYVSQVLNFNIEANGVLSGVPYLCRYFVTLIASLLTDKLIKSEKFSTTNIRKFHMGTFFFGCSFIFTLQAFYGYSSIISILVFCLCFSLMGLTTPGMLSNVVDISPNFSGTIYGISQIPGAVTGYMSTKIVAWATKERQDFEQWVVVFWILVAINFLSGIFVLIFISGEQQAWDRDEDSPELEKFNTIAQK